VESSSVGVGGSSELERTSTSDGGQQCESSREA